MYTQNPWVKYWNSRIQWVPHRPPSNFTFWRGRQKKFRR